MHGSGFPRPTSRIDFLKSDLLIAAWGGVYDETDHSDPISKVKVVLSTTPKVDLYSVDDKLTGVKTETLKSLG
jgi:hypothetical protein